MGSTVLAADYLQGRQHITDHFHDCHQIIYVSRGSAEITVSQKTYRARAGDLVLISRFEKHSVTNASEDYCRYTLKISPHTSGSLPASLDMMSLLVNRPRDFCHVFTSDSADTEHIFIQSEREARMGEAMSDTMLDMLFMQLLIMLFRLRPRLETPDSRELQLVGTLQRYMEENLHARHTLEALADMVYLSPSHMSHLFKRITGRSVMGYLLDCRMAKAKQLLTHTDDTVAEIVEKIGFADSSNFSRTFKAVTGKTPRDFRRENR